MTREKSIRIIQDTYPADSDHISTATTGKWMLTEARAAAWREESTAVLKHYAQLCLQMERRK